MSGYRTDSRPAMFGKKLSYNYYTRSNGVTSATVNKSVDRSVSHRWNSYPDSVYSFRSDRSESKNTLDYMLRNEDFNPFTQHDTGHEFWSTKHYVKNMVMAKKQKFSCLVQTSGSPYEVYYSGPIAITGLITDVGNVSPVGRAFNASIPNIAKPNLVPLGAKFIQAASPSRSSASLAVALTELWRDGLPKIPGLSLKKITSGKHVPHSAGDEYLNVVFGWTPLLSDIRQVLTAIVNARKIINQYASGSDTYIRRQRYAAPDVSTVLTTDPNFGGKLILTPEIVQGNSFGSPGVLDGVSGSSPGITQLHGGYSVRLSLVTKTTVRTWFSGAYRYHLNDGTDIFSRLDAAGQLAGRLLGARVNLLSAWQAMPWSWLADWFADIGTVIANGVAADLDGQVLQYGYLMQETTIESTISTDDQLVVTRLDGSRTNIGNLATTFVNQRKDRIKATPFGFGIDLNSLSAQRWAILGALGMTRGPKSLF